MKKLICAKDMEEFLESGKKVFYIDGNIILTPSAKDIAKNNNIEIATDKISGKIENCFPTLMENYGDKNLIEMFKQLVNKGLLDELLKTLKNINSAKFNFELDESGLKVIRGNSVKMDFFDTGVEDNKVYFQELISKEESSINSGFLTIEDSKFECELPCEEIHYVIEGIITVSINENSYILNQGDVLFIPKNSKVIFESFNKAKLFYTTY